MTPRPSIRAASPARVRRGWSALGLAAPVVLLLLLAPASATASTATDCSAYPEKRVFLESQAAWWPSGVTSYGAAEHVHAGTCFPYLQTVSGVVRFDVRSHLHNPTLPPGDCGTGDPCPRLEAVRVQGYNNTPDAPAELVGLAEVRPRRGCASADCEFSTTMNIDTSELSHDGLYEFRVHTEMKSADGAETLATNGWLVYVRNGKPVRDTTAPVRLPQSEGRGWYRLPDGAELGYENVRFLDELPTGPVSGVWTPRIRTLAGSDGEPVAQSFASVDPAFHAVPENRGEVLLDQPGPFNGSMAIDTTRLRNGPHKLFVRADADEPDSTRLSGALVVPFTVNNRPNTGITSEPPSPTADSTPAFTFSSESGAGFECRVDADEFASCESPHTTAALADGEHTFEVRAVDGAGNRDPTPAQRTFTVDTVWLTP